MRDPSQILTDLIYKNDQYPCAFFMQLIWDSGNDRKTSSNTDKYVSLFMWRKEIICTQNRMHSAQVWEGSPRKVYITKSPQQNLQQYNSRFFHEFHPLTPFSEDLETIFKAPAKYLPIHLRLVTGNNLNSTTFLTVYYSMRMGGNHVNSLINNIPNKNPAQDIFLDYSNRL